MKQGLLLFSCLVLSFLSFAQAKSFNHTDRMESNNPDHVKITLWNDSVHINFKDKSFKVNAIQDLDGWLQQHIAGITPPDVDLISYMELAPEKHREVIIITDKYRCPVVSDKTVSDGKPKVATIFRHS